MSYRDKEDMKPSLSEVAIAKGPFGLAAILIVLVVAGVAMLAQWIFS